jgi:hypothetical protein
MAASVLIMGWGGAVIYATAYSNNFETDIVTAPGLLNLTVQETFPWHVAFTAVLTFFLCFFPDCGLYIVKNICTYTHI